MKFSARSLTLAVGLLVYSNSGGAFTPAPWTATDTWWEVAFATVVALDCSQSVQIKPLGRYERNPLLPRHPSPGTMELICLGSVLGHTGVSYCLPVKWRRDFQVVTVFLETATVTDNYFRAGLSIKF
jgi:hypothetical protein